MADRLRIPGPRDVRGTREGPGATGVVVACPPHPQMGGDRRDARLRAVSDAVGEAGLDCLRIDYGPWGEGRGERTDVRSALAWAHDQYDAVGLFGYSFGGGLALLAAGESFREQSGQPAAVSVLAPVAAIGDLDATSAVAAIECPLQVLYGERDDTVESGPVAAAARSEGQTVESVDADHFYVGQQETVAGLVAGFFAEWL